MVRIHSKPPLFGDSQMGEVARHSRVGGGSPLSRLTPPTACGRSRRGSDSPPDCHSLPRLRFAYPLHKGAMALPRLRFAYPLRKGALPLPLGEVPPLWGRRGPSHSRLTPCQLSQRGSQECLLTKADSHNADLSQKARFSCCPIHHGSCRWRSARSSWKNCSAMMAQICPASIIRCTSSKVTHLASTVSPGSSTT